MQTFIVLQKIMLFRVDWRKIYNPNKYRLILIVHEPTLSKLSQEQKNCFTEIYNLPEFNFETLNSTIKTIIQSSDKDIKLITNDELCIELAAQLRESFNIAGDRPSIIKPFINKDYCKQLLLKHRIPMPKYIRFNPQQYQKTPDEYLQHIKAHLNLPIFAKPIDSAASQHTSKINTVKELHLWCEQHKNNENFELDEFIDGKLLQCDSIIQNNEILFAQVNENAHPCFDFMSGKITGGIKLPTDDPLVQKILTLNKQIIKALHPLPNCVTHLELFQRENGELIFLEIACRAPGGMIVQMHEKHTGINFEQANFAVQMGIPFDPQQIQSGPYCAWAWFPIVAGKVLGFKKLNIKSEHNIFWKIKPGEVYENAQSLIDYAGGILLWNDNYQKLRQDFDYLAQLKDSAVITDKKYQMETTT